MRSSFSLSAAAFASVFGTAALAQVQPQSTLDRPTQGQAAQVGRVVEGKLDRAEARHALRLDAGQTVRIAARSREFDTVLKLYGPTGAEPLAEDDDSGGGTVSELTFQAERAGTYQIGVSETGGGDEEAPAGRARAYDLTVLTTIVPPAAPPRPIAPNGVAPTPVDMAQCGAGCRFTFQATAGERLIAETSADDAEADPVLELRMGAEKIAEDDDSGNGVNARLVRSITRTGSYTLLARTVSGRGKYALSVSLRQPVVRPAVPLAVGTPASGRITADSQITDEGRSYDSYSLRGRAGQRLVIDLESADFDAELRVLGDTVLGPVQLASNDDIAAAGAAGSVRSRPQNLNSRLPITFERDGTVEIRAVSLTDQGTYTLRISEQAAAR